MILPAQQDLTVVPGGDFNIGVTWRNNGDLFDLTNKALYGAIRQSGFAPSATPDAAFSFNIDDAVNGHFFVTCARAFTSKLLMSKLYVYSWMSKDTNTGQVDEIQFGNIVLTVQPTLVP